MQQTNLIVRALLIISTTIILLAACAEMDSHSAISRFQQSENTYKASIRWGEWIGAFQLQRTRPENKTESTEKKPPSEEYLNHLARIKVARVEVLSSGMNEDKETGESLFSIEYRFDNSAKIKTIRHKVSWWHDKQKNIWFTSSPLPKEFDLPKSRTIKLSPKHN